MAHRESHGPMWNIRNIRTKIKVQNNSSVSRSPSTNVPKVQQMVITQTHTAKTSFPEQPDHSTELRNRTIPEVRLLDFKTWWELTAKPAKYQETAFAMSYTHVYNVHTQNTHMFNIDNIGKGTLQYIEYLLAQSHVPDCRAARPCVLHFSRYWKSEGPGADNEITKEYLL